MNLISRTTKWLEDFKPTSPGEETVVEELKAINDFAINANRSEEWLVKQLKTKTDDILRGMRHLSGETVWLQGAKLNVMHKLQLDLKIN